MILDGNQEAQKILYDRYIKIVKDFLLSKYSNYIDIDDDVSEILIKVFLKFDTYDSTKSKFKSWVFSIAKNYMIDKWRSNCNNIFTSSIPNENTNASVSYDNCSFNTSCVSMGSIDFENTSTLNFLSTQISTCDYTLLNMKYIQGYNYEEIGSEFNITSNTVSNRINYIKTKLKKNNSKLFIE